MRTSSPGCEPSTLPPVSAARSTTTEPGFMPSTIAAVTSSGAARPGTAAVVISDVGGGDVRREQLALALGAVLGHLAGVAAGALDGVEVEVDERGAHRADLVGRGRAHVVRADDRAQPLGGGDRLQAGDARAEDEHPRGLDGAGGGHQQREELGQPVGADQRGAVAGAQRLRGQRVHRLGPRDARQQLERQRGGPGVARASYGVERRALAHDGQERHRDAPGGELAEGLGRQRLDAQHGVGAGEHLGRGSGDLGAGLDVVGVQEAGRITGPGLDGDLEACVTQQAHGLGDGGDAALAWTGLGGNRGSHVHQRYPSAPRAPSGG